MKQIHAYITKDSSINIITVFRINNNNRITIPKYCICYIFTYTHKHIIHIMEYMQPAFVLFSFVTDKDD